MKKTLTYFFLLFIFIATAQQTPVYTQYTFNKAGVNPAASGIEIDKEYTYTFGVSKLWVDYPKSPTQSFFNLSYTIRPPRSYKSWQNAGVYFDYYNGGLFTNSSIYGTYTYHRLLRKTHVLSLGVMLGARRFVRSNGGFDNNDPAIYKTSSSIIVLPDMIPGIRFSCKKYFMGISAHQISIPKLQDFKGRKIGSPSTLQPSIYLEYGRMITVTDALLIMPSAAVNQPIIGPPLFDVNLMAYYANRLGLGVGIRNTSFFSGIFQLRFLENMTVGFAYSYSLNMMKYTAQNSYEIMIGITPMGMNQHLTGRHSATKCPSLSY